MVLTTLLGGGVESLSDLWVHLDGQALLLHQLVIALIDFLRDPVSEYALQHRGAHIPYPLLRQLGDLTANW